MVEVRYIPDADPFGALIMLQNKKVDSVVWGCKSHEEATRQERFGSGTILCIAAAHPNDPDKKKAKKKRKASKKRKKAHLNER